MQTKNRDAQKSVPHLAVFIVVAITSTGCTPWQLAKRTMHTELQQFPRVTDGKLSNLQYKKLARQEWKRYAANHPGEGHSSDYVSGFLQGFTQFVAAGGSTDPPAVPPRKYWKVGYRNPRGNQAIQDWFNGYSHGAKTAKENGHRERATIPSSLLLGYNKGVENRYADNLSSSESNVPTAASPQAASDQAPEEADPDVGSDEQLGSDALEQLMNDEEPTDPFNDADEADPLFDNPADEDDGLPHEESFEEMPEPALDKSTALSSRVDQASYLSPDRLEDLAAPHISTSINKLSASLRSDVDHVSVSEQPTSADSTGNPVADPKPGAKALAVSAKETPKIQSTKGGELSFELSSQPPVPPWSLKASNHDKPTEIMKTSLLEPIEVSKSLIEKTDSERNSKSKQETKTQDSPPTSSKTQDTKKSGGDSKLTLVGPMKPAESVTWSDVSAEPEEETSVDATSTDEPQWQARD